MEHRAGAIDGSAHAAVSLLVGFQRLRISMTSIASTARICRTLLRSMLRVASVPKIYW